MDTTTMAGWFGWRGDACPTSEVWITDHCMILRLSALTPETIAALRSAEGSRPVKKRHVDGATPLERLKNLVPVDGIDEFSDAPFGYVDLTAGGDAWLFAEHFLVRLLTALPGCEAFIATNTDPGATVGHAIVLKRNGEIVGALMGVDRKGLMEALSPAPGEGEAKQEERNDAG